MKNNLSSFEIKAAATCIFMLLASVVSAGEPQAEQSRLILDMVHHIPGEERYTSPYEDPAVVKQSGFNGKVYFLFDSPTLATNWESVDPDIFPKGSKEREWVDAKAEQIKKQQQACHAIGVSTYAMSDLILFPKRLIEKYSIEKTFGDPNDPQTQKFLRAQLDETFKQFPDLDGLVVRIGETYMQDAPYHQGKIDSKNDASKSIIPLISLLREEICVKRGKTLIFRTWRSFDEKLNTYNMVSDAIEPHPQLIISVKHVENDFRRTHPFSKVIGQGRHRQIIEVQCAREYEGKGAYPNYIAKGVIEGFEEHASLPEGTIRCIGDFARQKPGQFAGMWTWSRGGGWAGPYIKNELWCDLNAWVIAQWAKDPLQKEEVVFNRYAVERLKLNGEDVVKFRKLCLLSADAVVRGVSSTRGDMSPTWTRDQGIGWPSMNKNSEAQARNLKEKDESVEMWKEIVGLAESIQWSDEPTKAFAVSSAKYGLSLYEIYRSVVLLVDAQSRGDEAVMKNWISSYDEAWKSYDNLVGLYPCLSTLYTKSYNKNMNSNADKKVEELRKKIP